MSSHIESRETGLPRDLRQALVAARKAAGWSQAALGNRVGLPQMHISGIERGRVVPRYDTLLELVRALGLDLVLLPRVLVPAVEAMVRDHRAGGPEGEERPLYQPDEEDEAS
jgi:transcriptional regulator with XRE-family HTH domain